jgi:hypothetical protein
MAAFKQDRGLAVQVPLDLGDIAVRYCTVHLCGIYSCLFLPRTYSTILIPPSPKMLLKYKVNFFGEIL